MFKIHKHQKAPFIESRIKQFEDRTVMHLRKFFPSYCDILGEAGVRSVIREGIDRSQSYGIVSERGVCLYIDVMFAFGREFDRDPRLAWASGILNNPSIKSPIERINLLFDASFEHIDQALGVCDTRTQK